MHTAKPLVPEPSPPEVEITTEMLRRYKPACMDQILTELIQEGSKTLYSDIKKLTNSIYSKKELTQQWKESITVSIYKIGGKTKCSNYIRTPLLITTYKILSHILVLRLITYVDEIIGYH
jgi:predicted nucleotide-binding protein (sugar kinase/HSP70/actin superfamily)